MKKVICCMLLIAALLSLTACGQNGANSTTGASVPSEPSQPSSAATVPSETAGAPGYCITVVDTEGNPVAGAVVQMCKIGGDGSCTPSATDAEGRAVFQLAKDNYKVSFVLLPPAYTYVDDVQEFHFDGDSMQLTITVKKA